MKKIFNKEVMIGVWVLVALVILVFGINFLKGINLLKASNYYYASYTNVSGLALSAPVTLNGFKVGQVRDIAYDYENPGHVKVEISLDKELQLPLNSQAVLASDILGTASIALQLGQGPGYYKVGDVLPGKVQSGMLDAVSNQLMPAVSTIFPKVDTLLTTINSLAGDPALKLAVERLDGITADLRRTTMLVSNMAAQLSGMPQQINPILADAHAITGNLKTMSGDLTTITADVSALTGQLKEMPVDSLLANIQTTTDNLRMLTEQMNNPNSSLGMLMRDPALYNNLNNTISSLDSLFIDVKKNPKRYINLKVF